LLEDKDKDQLLTELSELRRQIAQFKRSELDHKRELEELKTNTQRLQTLFERHHAVMLLIEPDSGKIIDANLAASRFYGYTRNQLSSMNISEINQLNPDEIAHERKLAKNEERNYFIFPHRLAGGEARTVEVHSTPIDINGQLLLFSIIHDITDRKRAEEGLKRYQENLEELVKERTAELEIKNRMLTKEIAERMRAEEKAEQLASIVASSDDAIIGKSLDGTITSWNKGAEKLYGYSSKEAIGRSILFLIPPDSHEDITNILATIKRGEHTSHSESSRQKKDGTIINVSLTISPTWNTEGEIVGAATIARDISELKQAQHQRERLILELQEALAKVRTLSGLLPICASCKKIRDDKGYWEQIEVYIRDRSEAEFSHGICPECAQKLYPDFYKKK
jgi:PAS domain S-box-containing protein